MAAEDQKFSYVAPGKKPKELADKITGLRDALKDARAQSHWLAVLGTATVVANLFKVATAPSRLAGMTLGCAFIQVGLSIVGGFRGKPHEVNRPEEPAELSRILAWRRGVLFVSTALFLLSLLGLYFLYFGSVAPVPKAAT